MDSSEEFATQVEKMRAVVFDDLAPIDVAAVALKKSKRQIYRLIDQKRLRAVRMGKDVFVVVSALREALMGHGNVLPTEPVVRPRPVGRPRKVAVERRA